MKMTAPSVAVTLLAGALLAACTPVPPPTPTPLPPTTTPIPPTPTPLPTPTPTPTPTLTPTPTPIPLVLSSSALEPGGQIPERFGFFRENTSPEMRWENVPAGTQSLALLVEDRDFPFTHWVVYNIPPDVTGLPEGVIAQPQLPDGTRQGLNGNEVLGYIGPFPPSGEVHRYSFTLYALDAPLDLGPGARGEQVLAAMEGRSLAESKLTGTYVGVTP